MRIAQISPLMTNVPPRGYGGPERCVSYLTEELVKQGHDVTLFATEGSQTSARLVPVCPYPLIDHDEQEWIIFHMNMLEQVFKQVDDFDIIHNHIEYYAAPYARRYNIPFISTIHTNLDYEMKPIYDEFNEASLIAISEYQKNKLFPELNWKKVIHHGIPSELYAYQPNPQNYLVFLGRLSKTKGILDAVEVALRAKIPIKIAGNPDGEELPFFEKELKPLFENPLVEYVGEVSDEQKKELLGNAHALVFPINAEEAFGLVMIEALACGTPVIARKLSSVVEIIEDGVTGFNFQTIDEALACVKKISKIERSQCRKVFESRFTATRMALEHETLYKKMIEEHKGDKK